MKKTFLLLFLGLIVGYALSYLPVKQTPSQITKHATDESKTLLASYFPIKKGSVWEYKGTKKEQVEGKIETSDTQKKVEVNDIATGTEINTLSVTGDGQVESWVVTDNKIDFKPNSTQDKFILTFPLYVGQKWGDEEQLRNRNDGYYVWEVEQKLSQVVLGKNYDECFRIALKMLTGTEYKIFCYGIGIVEEGYKHNGSLLEEISKLTAYQ